MLPKVSNMCSVQMWFLPEEWLPLQNEAKSFTRLLNRWLWPEQVAGPVIGNRIGPKETRFTADPHS